MITTMTKITTRPAILIATATLFPLKEDDNNNKMTTEQEYLCSSMPIQFRIKYMEEKIRLREVLMGMKDAPVENHEVENYENIGTACGTDRSLLSSSCNYPPAQISDGNGGEETKQSESIVGGDGETSTGIGLGAFEERIEELVQFKKNHGHCDVPAYDDTKSLGIWCNSTKVACRRFESGDDTRGRRINEYRLRRLREIGFEWGRKKVYKGRVDRKSFNERFGELKIFIEINGHCRVPRYGETRQLSAWCGTVRMGVKRFELGEIMKPGTTHIDEERLKMFKDIGFDFRSPQIVKFEKWIDELKCFKEKYGHCDVPRSGKTKRLGIWFFRLRNSYRSFEKGLRHKEILIDEERLRILKEIGIDWTC